MNSVEKYLKEELLPSSSKWDDYDFLRDLIRAGEVDKAKECLQMGFRVNKYSLCMHHLEHVHTTPLHAAVDLGNEELIKLLVEKGASINARDYNCDTPLTLAANSEKYQIVDYLLSVSSTKNTGNEFKFDHLLISCMRNRVDVAKKLFQYGGACRNHAVLMNAPTWPGWNALHFAVCFECIEMVQFLLDHGIEIRARDKKGSTPLHFAFEKQNETIIDKILAVHRHYPGNPINCQGLSHFHIVCARNNVELVKDFAQRNIKLNYKVSRKSPKWKGFNAINFAIEYGNLDVLRCLKACNKISCFVNDKNFRSLVRHAQEKNHPAIVNFLDSCKCCKKTSESQGCSSQCLMETDEPPEILPDPELPRFLETTTPLHFAVQQAQSPSLKFLEKHKSDIIVKDSRGKTPLHLAFENDRMDIVEKLVTLHEDILENPTDNNGLSHFHIFCSVYNLDIVDKFIENGVDVNGAINMDSTFFPGFSPLHMAIRFDTTELVELLLTHRADLTQVNGLGTNAFELAIQHIYMDLPVPRPFSCFRVLELVLSEIGHRKMEDFDTKGYTLLHIASAENDIEAIKRLANEYNLNATIRSDLKPQFKGFTPLHFAAFYHQDEAIELLLDLGADNSARDFRGNTPAHSRLRHPDYWVLQDNIDSRLLFCKENFTSADGTSNLHLVCRRNDLEAVRHYLDMGVDVNARIRDSFSSRDYATPLHLALNGGCKKVSELLLERGADINSESRSGRTPLITYSPDIPPEERLQLIVILMKHIKKLELIKRHVSQKNLKWYAIFMGERELTDIYREQEFIESCTKELEAMKTLRLNKFCTLYDILHRNSNAMSRLCKNDYLREIIDRESLKIDFPNYWSFLNLSFEKGIARMHLLDKAESVLNNLSVNWLNSVSRSVVEYLSNEEIEFFCKNVEKMASAEQMEE
ncbi:hypothetical protein QAD02_006473 [Eretmocerus hayati]|uniref:Uncharacterized protein n=1 Tax=Eretmocerus hayati TaxID=131215 RepID=A0ACC2N247_9HYME|nr:hypothetical protein QAD02_006473 [Eretmocerus hayati]